MKRVLLLIFIIIAILITAIVLYKFVVKDTENPVMVEAENGPFEVIVSCTGELQAQNSIKIMGPIGLRRVGIYSDVKILHMEPEGTIVDSGQHVASLDKSEVTNKLKNVESEIQEIEAKLLQTKLSAAMTIRSAKDDLVDLEYRLEEAKIELEQSKYETPASIRQAEINLNKAERAYKQSLSNYKLKVKKAKAEIQEIKAALNQKLFMKDNLVAVMEEFEIYAPSQGMLIYYKSWRGKTTAGSSISPWDPIVATLPDFSTMVSKTYINEIDISKIKLHQKVKIGIDAFPEKKFTGEVVEIANIGEQLPRSNAKVFEVIIKINEMDSILRPAMTTSNEIITAVYNNVVYIPLDVVHNNDSISYVYKKGGRILKQIVILGESSDDEVIVIKGLNEGDKVLFTEPKNSDRIDYTGLELLNNINTGKDDINSNISDSAISGQD